MVKREAFCPAAKRKGDESGCPNRAANGAKGKWGKVARGERLEARGGRNAERRRVNREERGDPRRSSQVAAVVPTAIF